MLAALLVAFGLAVQACRTAQTAPRRLADSASSPEDLANRFLSALAANDLDGMRTLRITKQEFCDYVFPELPASKMPNVSCDWVWDQATLKSMAGMKRMLDANQAQTYALVSVRFEGEEPHDTYRVLKSPVVTVRDASGAVRELRLFGSMLEMDGQYKLFSFVVD